MSAGHGQAQRLHHCCVGVYWHANGVTEDDVALSTFFPSGHQDAVLPCGLWQPNTAVLTLPGNALHEVVTSASTSATDVADAGGC